MARTDDGGDRGRRVTAPLPGRVGVVARGVRPAATLMGRLRYSHKFLVIGLITLVPTVLALSSAIAVAVADLAVVQREREGLTVVRELVDVQEALLDVRHAALTGTDTTAGAAALERELTHVDRLSVDWGLGDPLRVKWQDLYGTALFSAGATGSDLVVADAVDRASQQLLVLIDAVAETSGLIRDEGDTGYQLMDVLVVQVPKVNRAMAGVHDTIATVRSDGDDTGATVTVGLAAGLLGDVRSEIVHDRDSLREADPDGLTVKTTLEAMRTFLDVSLTTQNQLTLAVDTGSTRGITLDAVEESMTQVMLLADAARADLAVDLDGRADAARTRAGVYIGLAVLLCTVFLYVFMGCYCAVMDPLRTIVATLTAVAEGASARRAQVDTRDEMRFVAGQLNRMLDRNDEVRSELADQATHDALTGLPNRSHSLALLNRALHEASAGGHQVGVMFIDLDRFKQVNDTWGHDVGDQVLCEVAARLQSGLRKHDMAGRLAGDEFLVVLHEVDTIEAAQDIADRITGALVEPIHIVQGGQSRMLASGACIGLAISGQLAGPTDEVPDAEDLLRRADIAMYEAKQQGRSVVKIFDSSMAATAERRLKLEAQIALALERGEFVAHYQPLVDLRTGRWTGAEALVRWNHPVDGVLSPADFVPVAEMSGLIVPLGAQVLEQACRQGAVWLGHDGIAPGFRVSVNVAPAQWRDRNFVATVVDALDRTGLPATALCLEITESTVMADEDASLRTLTALRSHGVTVSLDDFGTGFSSLAYLRRFPVDQLKIDRSFIDPLGSSTADAEIVRMIVDLAHLLGMEVVGEGVESQDQARILTALGCDLAQGYVFARPQPGGSLSAVLTHKSPSPL